MENKQSGLGIASFVISLVVGVIQFCLVAYAGYLQVGTPGGMDKNSSIAVLLGLAMIGMFLLEFVALALSIAGMLQKDRRRTFSVLGCIFSTVVIICSIGIYVYGMSIA